MSILQEYKWHEELFGKKKRKAIQAYLSVNQALQYSDVVYQKKEWQNFEKWYKKIYNNKHEGDSGKNTSI